MDTIAVDAIAALEAALASIMPAGIPAGLSRDVRVVTQRIRPTGLGGFVGLHTDPTASLYGRRLNASVLVRVAGDVANAQAYAAQLSGQVLAQSRADLSLRGFQRLSGQMLTPTQAGDPPQIAFDVDFEYVPVPEVGEGVISTLDLELFNNVTPYQAVPRWDFDGASLATQALPLAEFFAADDTDLDAGSPPGAWSFQAAPAPHIAQTQSTHGGPFTLASAVKAGTQLLWRPKGLPLAIARGVMEIDFNSASANGIGAVFGRRAASDHWFLLMSQVDGYHVFGRRTPGNWAIVGTPARAGFSLAASHRLTVGFYDRTLFAELDGVRTLSVATNDTVLAGEAGLLTHGNDGTSFFSGRLLELV